MVYIKSYLTIPKGIDRYVENDAPTPPYHPEGIDPYGMQVCGVGIHFYIAINPFGMVWIYI